jgi:hypothetical protein
MERGERGRGRGRGKIPMAPQNEKKPLADPRTAAGASCATSAVELTTKPILKKLIS